MPTNLEDIPPDAIAAKEARCVAEIRGFFWSDEFAAAVGRHKQYISDSCRARKIKTMRGGKPYRIPYTEYEQWINPRT